jgi:polyisoprenoid-binding protein YceI
MRTFSFPARFFLTLLSPCVLLFGGSIGLAAESLEVDPGQSSVKFVGTAFMHSFHGEAKDLSGNAELDSAAVPPVQRAMLHFKTAALTTFNKERDQKMFEWLKITIHPDAHFSLEAVKALEGDSQQADAQHPAKFVVRGFFTLNGVKKPLDGSALGWREKDRLIVSGETIIDTLKYGLPQIRQAFMTVGTDVKVAHRFSFILPREYAAK